MNPKYFRKGSIELPRSRALNARVAHLSERAECGYSERGRVEVASQRPAGSILVRVFKRLIRSLIRDTCQCRIDTGSHGQECAGRLCINSRHSPTRGGDAQRAIDELWCFRDRCQIEDVPPE